MPVLGEDAVFAAVVVECAAEQGAFWPFHDRFMADDSTLFTELGLNRQAAFEGLDVERFRSCIENGETFPIVSASYEEGGRRGVRSTPTIFINGVQVDPVWDDIRSAVEAALDAGQ